MQYKVTIFLGITRAEMILKVVMSPLEPARAFVEQYVRLVQGKEMSSCEDC